MFDYVIVRGNPCFIDENGHSMLCITEIVAGPMPFVLAKIMSLFISGSVVAHNLRKGAGPGIAQADVGDWGL
jgi:hypothetical protein